MSAPYWTHGPIFEISLCRSPVVYDSQGRCGVKVDNNNWICFPSSTVVTAFFFLPRPGCLILQGETRKQASTLSKHWMEKLLGADQEKCKTGPLTEYWLLPKRRWLPQISLSSVFPSSWYCSEMYLYIYLCIYLRASFCLLIVEVQCRCRPIRYGIDRNEN